MKRALRWCGERLVALADRPAKPRRWPLFLLGALAGVVGCYLTVDWRIGAADAHAKLYARGAMQSHARYVDCVNKREPWQR